MNESVNNLTNLETTQKANQKRINVPNDFGVLFKQALLELLETSYISVIVIWLLYTLVAVPETVFGASMEPTFYTGERILVEKVLKNIRTYNRGEIVILEPPGYDREFIKRVVGVEGDILKIFECRVYISRDGERYVLQEDYLSDTTCTSSGKSLLEGRSYKVQEGEYVVLGDNRGNSNDSRNFGIVNKSDIKGKVVLRFWPLDRITFF